jgi:sec-independent protein translocase protein TatA
LENENSGRKKMLGSLGMQEILLILVVVLLLFGAKRIPEVMRSLGSGIQQFKRGMREIESGMKENQRDKEEDRRETFQG